jgi:hypothetical protein
MRFTVHHKDFGAYSDAGVAPTCGVPIPERQGVVRRLLDMLFEPHRQQFDRKMASLVRSGGRLTDSMEREMMQHMTSSNWGRR